MAQDPFFEEKRPWSSVKDGILEYYIDYYLKKVQSRRVPILIIDTFAGPGEFKDGKQGSPLIIASKCEKRAADKYTAVFTNIEKDQHTELEERLEPFQHAHARLMRAGEILRHLNDRIEDQSLFLYLDPYGLEDCDFDLIKPLLDRTRRGDFSTELLIVFQMPYLHRQASRDRVLEAHRAMSDTWAESGTEGEPPTIDDAISILGSEQRAKIENVDRIMGGEYWRDIEYSELEESERAERLVEAYMERLAHPDKLAMSCPVNIDFEDTSKYYIVFVSRHMDAVVGMNEAMLKSTDAFYSFNAEQCETEDPTLFGVEESPWHRKRQADRLLLRRIIPEYIAAYTRRLSRSELWTKIISDDFMRYSQSDYRRIVADLVRDGLLRTKGDVIRPNDDTVLCLPGDPMP